MRRLHVELGWQYGEKVDASVFKLFGGILALTFWVVAVALKVLIVGGVLYLGVRLVAPGTAQRLRDRFSGTRLTRY